MCFNRDIDVIILEEDLEILVQMKAYRSKGFISLTQYKIALFFFFPMYFYGFYQGFSRIQSNAIHLLSDFVDVGVYYSLKMWLSISIQRRCRSLQAVPE